jgi:hypothetical protein
MLELTDMSEKERPNKKSRAAREKLGDLPFKTVSEQKQLREEIEMQVARQLETARAFERLTQHPDYQFFKEKFQKGMHCRYGEAEGDIVHVYMNDDGIQVTLNEKVNSKDKHQRLLIGVIMTSLTESLLTSYYRAYGYLPHDADKIRDDLQQVLDSLKNKS